MENEILNKAILKLTEVAGLKCDIYNAVKNNVKHKTEKYLRIRTENTEYNFYVVVKTKFVLSQILMLKETVKDIKNFVLITDYITTQAKELLKANDINYIDTIGNIYLKTNSFFVFVEINKTNRTVSKTINRAFKAAGLKVVFQFLVNSECVNLPYRQIADRANVAIDTVGKVIKELLRDNYIVKKDSKNYQVTDKKRLFEDWATNFNKNLKPKLIQKKYRFLHKDTEFKTIVLPESTYWGGAYAAEIITNYLDANTGLIYTDLDFSEVMKDIKLLPDSNGNITIIEKFWTSNEMKNTVHPMLVFADLIAENNPRYLETANLIYKNYVENYL